MARPFNFYMKLFAIQIQQRKLLSAYIKQIRKSNFGNPQKCTKRLKDLI